VQVTSVLAGNATAIDIPTDATVQLNLQDPDSMTLDLTGDIVLDSQADQELIVVSDPGGPNQQAYRLPLSFESTTGLQRVQADDTAFATSTQGFILFADKVLNTVFKLSKNVFAPNAMFTAANGRSVCRYARYEYGGRHADCDGSGQPRRDGVCRYLAFRRQARSGSQPEPVQ
jgi:hypothetical protein